MLMAVTQNITGHFLLLGITNVPFRYKIAPVRDGYGYAQRRVDVTQDQEGVVVFTCVCSFKTAEMNMNERFRESRLDEEYRDVMKGKRIDELPEAPGVDSPL
jgi:acyl-CoA thioesterase